MSKIDISPVKQEIIGETSKIAWKELQTFFAKGIAIYVSEDLDLVDVAVCFVEDNKPMVEKWIQDNQIMSVTNEQAKTWYEDDALVWAVVVKPWILVQPVKILQ